MIDRTYLEYVSSFSKYVLGCLRIKKSDIITWLGVNNQLPLVYSNELLLNENDTVHKIIIESVLEIFDSAFSKGSKDNQKEKIEQFLNDYNVLFTKSKIIYIIEYLKNNEKLKYKFDLELFEKVFYSLKENLF